MGERARCYFGVEANFTLKVALFIDVMDISRQILHNMTISWVESDIYDFCVPSVLIQHDNFDLVVAKFCGNYNSNSYHSLDLLHGGA